MKNINALSPEFGRGFTLLTACLGLFVVMSRFPGSAFAAEAPKMPAAEAAQAEQEIRISFEDILSDPDNALLNLRYAEQQVAEGRPRGALAALERVLAADPGRHAARLFYARTLLGLGDISDAERELNTLSAGLPPADILAQIESFRRDIRRRRNHTNWSGRLGVGWEHASNRNASPSSGRALLFDSPLDLRGSAVQRADTGMTFLGRLDARHVFGSRAGHEMFASFTYNRTEQTALKTLNLQAYSIAGGGVGKFGVVSVTPTLLFDHVVLAQTTLLRSRGGSLRLDVKTGPRAVIFLEGRDVYQDYSRTAFLPTARQRNGIQAGGGGGLDFWATPTMKLGARYDLTIKHASLNVYSFNRSAATISHVWLLGKGSYLATSGTAAFDQYPHPDFFISSRQRKDDTWTAATTLGLPLSLIASPLKNLLWSATFEYYEAVSNIINYSYTNKRVATSLVYHWASS